MVHTFISDKDAQYAFSKDGTFIIENYNLACPFSSFFPGIAGLKGIPMWVFYVNRGQGIASFGIKGKNYSMMEFQPANRSYHLTSQIGFRTFIRFCKGQEILFYEPFQHTTAQNVYTTRQRMLIRPEELVLEEINESLGLRITVTYFTLPQEPLSALMRTVEIKNIGQESFTIEVIDGLPKIIPYWMSNDVLKYMSHTAQAWAKVRTLGETGQPFYRLKVEIIDKPEVHELGAGNFYCGLLGKTGELKYTKVIVDPELIFGEVTNYSHPAAFLRNNDFIVPEEQFGNNKYPAAMSYFTVTLSAGEDNRFYSLIGHAESESQCLNYLPRIRSAEYFQRKRKENTTLIEGITKPIYTESNQRVFDLYCRQTFLDNVLRGGMPIQLQTGDGNIVFYVYSRKHGDLERDYNNYQISPTYYSQGDGNFRDVNQNKRANIYFYPKIQDFDVMAFYNLLQLDGYNPLLVKGTYFVFSAQDKENKKRLEKLTDKKGHALLQDFFTKHFEPGGLLLFVEHNDIKLKVSEDEFLSQILVASRRMTDAEHGEGFWVDHWTYNLDLLESYLGIYPEKAREILLEKKEFTYYDNAHVVMPRTEKYIEADGKIRQFGAVIRSAAKTELLKSRTINIHLMRDKKGKGNVYCTTLLGKILCLLLNKLSTLDPEGIGIEMEADKPGWYDALNGLPGVFGSSVPEAFELKRLILFIRNQLRNLNIPLTYQLSLAEEIYSFYQGLRRLLERQKRLSPFAFWDAASMLKEKYRESVFFGVQGAEKKIIVRDLVAFLDLALGKVNQGLKKAIDKKTGLFYTYFTYEPQSYQYLKTKKAIKMSHKGWLCVKIDKFKKRPLPLFLEAEAHYLKTESEIEKIRQHFTTLKQSPLYDHELGMYKVNAALEKEPADIGRCTVFAPGWLENESVWLHMEYKYLLELLNSGLYEEFFNEFEKAGICFQEPGIYGRSILENSSFIVSSAFPDKRMWGRGCVARLSGSTAEFVEMWLLITIGAKPFRLDAQGRLVLEFKPAIPARYFTAEGIFTCMFLTSTKLVYHNEKNIDTFSPQFGIKKIEITWKNGQRNIVEQRVINKEFAESIRNQEAQRIDIYF